MASTILLVGCGKMGNALLQGWGKNGSYIVSTLDPNADDADYHSVSDITTSFDVIVLAVKPQIIQDVATTIRHLITPSTLLISIAAGKTIGFFEQIFGTSTPIVRVMPNTPALIGKGISVLCGNDATTEQFAQLSMNLMAAVGDVEWIDDEGLMDAVTALSGSGPAYVFHLVEAMTAAGVQAGLTPALSEKLARQTIIGSAALMDFDRKNSISTLRKNVTSPGGTTEAGLEILMSDKGLTDLMTRTILAAQQRGKELGS